MTKLRAGMTRGQKVLFFMIVLSPVAIAGVTHVISNEHTTMIFIAIVMPAWMVVATIAAWRL